jgi:fused signal recognition particle receptor
MEKTLPEKTITTWLTIDSMLGQSGINQAQLFHDATNLDGIILTKLDGTGKGGIIFSITQSLHLPIVYVTTGETLDDIKIFDATHYIQELFTL